MFGIVTTISALETVLKGSSRWKTIIQKLMTREESSYKIYAFKDRQDQKIEKNSNIFFLSQAKHLEICPEIEKFPSVSLLRKYSSCAFLMDIDPANAAKIQEQYGVICQSVSQLDDSILTTVAPDHFELEYHDKKKYGWAHVLSGLADPRIPSNSLIINDRNIFTNDKILEGKETYGLDNIIALLDVLLPKTFNESDDFPYHVLIIYQTDTDGNPKMKYLTDPDEIEKERVKENEREQRRLEKFHKLSEMINESKLRPYKVVLELIGLKRDNPFFNRTHNRRIYSNYYTISCDHQVAAFEDRISRCCQSIEVLKLFSKLDKKGSDQPLKGHDAFVKSLSKSINEWECTLDYKNTYWISMNGHCDRTIHSLENRLVSSSKKQ